MTALKALIVEQLDEIKDMDAHERCELRYEKLKSFNSEVMLPC
jgi:acetyl-CoA carboxylase carboxyl transferase subunit alpha